eukprot:3348224-Alexandrium_andersonii.AAC.2
MQLRWHNQAAHRLVSQATDRSGNLHQVDTAAVWLSRAASACRGAAAGWPSWTLRRALADSHPGSSPQAIAACLASATPALLAAGARRPRCRLQLSADGNALPGRCLHGWLSCCRGAQAMALR